jgi:hypothetical protein
MQNNPIIPDQEKLPGIGMNYKKISRSGKMGNGVKS